MLWTDEMSNEHENTNFLALINVKLKMEKIKVHKVLANGIEINNDSEESLCCEL